MLRKGLHVTLTDDARQQTAQATRATQADLVGLQEVDDSRVLDDFHDLYLERFAGVQYSWRPRINDASKDLDTRISLIPALR